MLKEKFDDVLKVLAGKGITPNHITLGRIPFCFFGWLIWVYQKEIASQFKMEQHWQFIGAFAFLLVTLMIVADLLDGYFARLTNQITEDGKIIDPLADKLITYVTLALFWSEIDKFLFFTLLMLDLLSTLLRKVKTEGANCYGKYKAFLQNIAIACYGLAFLLGLPFLNLLANVILLFACSFASVSVGIRLLKSFKATFTAT